MAEAHPVGFRWAMKARERGAKLIHVDPHYSRTSAVSDTVRPDPRGVGHRVPRRADPPHHRDRLVLQGVRRQLHERGDDRRRGLRGHRGPRGLLLAATTPRRGPTTARRWMYEGAEDAGGRRRAASTPRRRSARRRAPACTTGNVSSDETLQHPRCVFQLLKKHYARYTPEMVERVCGIPRETFLEVAETLIANSGRERTSDVRLRRQLDAALDRRADDPRRRDRPAAARQHRAPGRRHHGDARPRLDPGLERHPDALRPAPRLPADAQGLGERPHARELHRDGRLVDAAGGATSTSTSSRC